MPEDGYTSQSDRLLAKFDSFSGQFYGKYHDQVKENRAFYDLEFADKVKGGIEGDIRPYIPPSAPWAIDEAADHILNDVLIKVPVRPTESDNVTEQEIAEKKRKFLNALWHQVTQRYNIVGDGKKDYLNEGMIAVKKTLRWDLIPDKDSETYRRDLAKLGRLEFLWDFEVLDNLTVFPDPTNHRNPQYVYLSYEILTEEAKRLFPGAQGEWTNLGDYDKVRYLEYWSAPTFKSDGTWDEGDYWQWIEREPVHEGKNPYPYIPIAIEDPGFGSNRKNATAEKRFVGMSQKQFDMYVAEARQFTSMENMAEISAFGLFFTRNFPPDKVIKVGPTVVNPLEGASDDLQREEVELQAWPPMPPEVLQIIQKTNEYTSSTMKAGILAGIPQRGVDTATEADANIRNASAKLSGPVAGLQRLIAKLSRWALMDVELVLEAPVTVYGAGTNDPAEVTLGPREISGYYEVHTELRTSDKDAISDVKARRWADLYQRIPWLSGWTAMERGEIAENPMEEMLRRMSEDVVMSEEFTQMRKLAAAQIFGELAQMLQAFGQTQGGGQGDNSANQLTGTSERTPTLDRIRDTSLEERDVNQAAAAIR